MYLVVGAGWYGCRVSQELKRLGVDFAIVDKCGDFFQESSSNNQNRLHQGFHYPRCSRTRLECSSGFSRFVSEYPSSKIVNAYVVSKESLLDYGTYCLIYKAEGTPFTTIPPREAAAHLGAQISFDNLDGDVIMCDERCIDHEACAATFKQMLGQYMLPPHAAVVDVSDSEAPTLNGKRVQHVFDCTYGHLKPLPVPAWYEVCVSMVYRAPTSASRTAITVMDGDFFSIYPYRDGMCTLTHVKHTPLRGFEDSGSAAAYRSTEECARDCAHARRRMEREVDAYIPGFSNMYSYQHCFVSVKTKFPGRGSDDRSLRVFSDGKVTSLIGGKITGVFEADQVVRDVVCVQPDVSRM